MKFFKLTWPETTFYEHEDGDRVTTVSTGVDGHASIRVNPLTEPRFMGMIEIAKEEFDEAFYKALKVIRDNHKE